MNEIILFSVVLIILVFGNLFAQRIKQPILFYIKLIAFFGLMLLVWVIESDGKIAPKLIITSVVFYGIYQAYITLRKTNRLTKAHEDNKTVTNNPIGQ
jgi:hypothetical protein